MFLLFLSCLNHKMTLSVLVPKTLSTLMSIVLLLTVFYYPQAVSTLRHYKYLAYIVTLPYKILLEH